MSPRLSLQCFGLAIILCLNFSPGLYCPVPLYLEMDSIRHFLCIKINQDFFSLNSFKGGGDPLEIILIMVGRQMK